jgi:DNA-binding NarL/FixJ family response regulator
MGLGVMESMFKTLIVEDSPNFRKILRMNLSDRFPFIVIDEATDGEETPKKIKVSVPDLVFMDIELPGTDGLELTKGIRAVHGNINIVVRTSHSDRAWKKAAFACGDDAFFTEGLSSLEEIVAVVDTLIASKR